MSLTEFSIVLILLFASYVAFYYYFFYKGPLLDVPIDSLFIYLFLFLAALGLCCQVRAFFSCSKRGLLFIAVHGLLIVVASLVAEHGL